MGFSTNGFVLRPPRTAPGNATSTGDASSGVPRDIRNLPTASTMTGKLVEIAADQYRASVLQNPETTETQEFLLWAANSSSLTLLEDPTWAIDGDPSSVTIPTGDITVGAYKDGSDRVVVQDEGGRAIAEVTSMTIVRGDTLLPIPASFVSPQDADGGIVTLSAPTLTLLGGGVSRQRGDSISAVSYIIAAARFWWSRNDYRATRFGWNGRTQKWEPLKGSPPKNLGVLYADGDYALTPKPTRFSVGDYLPRDLSTTDSFAIIRVGLFPDSTSQVPEILVVPDQQIEDGYVFTAASPDAVMGVTNGILQWNDYDPGGGSYLDNNTGQLVWYNPETFPTDSNGAMGYLKDVEDEPVYLSPVPGPTDRPFIRLGFRRYLNPVPLADDAALATYSPSEGAVGWSQTTGKLKFNHDDVLKADPDDTSGQFDLQYLGCQVYYDGVSLTTRSMSTRAPVQLVDSSGNPTTVGSGDLYIPQAQPFPAPGTSGVIQIADETGTLPNTSEIPNYRPNGCGLVRRIDSVGDTILFGPSGAIEIIEQYDLNDDLTKLKFKIKQGVAEVALEPTTVGSSTGSQVKLGRKDERRFDGQPMYFLQADVQPAVYTAEARIYSREIGPYTLDGTEVFVFHIDGTTHEWLAATTYPSGATVSASDLAADLEANSTPPVTVGSVYGKDGHIIIESANPASGIVEIGFGTTVTPHELSDRDISGCAVMGFLPGWQAQGGSDNWLPDNGSVLGAYRSPQNRDRSSTIPDIKARATFSNAVLSDSLIANPFLNLDFPPLRDVAGYDQDVFFVKVDGFDYTPLHNLDDVLYDFGNGRIAFLEEATVGGQILQASAAINLGNPSVVADTLHPAVGSGYGLYVSYDTTTGEVTGGTLTLLREGEDFILPAEGAPGLAYIVDAFGGLVDAGAAGSFSMSGTTFTDPNGDFLGAVDPSNEVFPGYRLKILSGDAAGSYIVASVTSGTQFEIDPSVTGAFPASGTLVSWQMFTGLETDVYDPGIVADAQYTQFNHLPEEPFKVRALSLTGDVPPNPASQALNRNKAVVTEAMQSGRPMSIRVGLDYGNPEFSMVPLEQTELGTMGPGLQVPWTGDTHFINADFSIRVGTRLYTQDYPASGDGLLEGVPAFTSPADDRVQYINDVGSGDYGKLAFGAQTLDEMEGSSVDYVQEFLTPSAVIAGTVEYSPATGELNFNSLDMAAYAGTPAYFVERMITEDRKDVAISPFNGSFYFNRPLRKGQIVEASYYQADSQQNRATDSDGSLLPEITEFLPLYVRLETATRIDATTYGINPTGKTIAGAVLPQVWVGINYQNYAGREEALLDAAQNRIQFTYDVDAAEVVQVNYAVFEAFGGEQTYSTSTTPVWRPPFMLEAEQTDFTLETDRTGDLVPGRLLRIGATPFYVKAASYNALADQTSVTVWPASAAEAGTRAPGNDILTLLSDRPVALEVDGTPTAGSPGFLMPLLADYEPADRGMLSIIFKGNVTQFAVAGHLLEMNGYPLIIAGSTLSDDGLTTKVDLTSALPTGFDSSTDPVKISVRPLYNPTPTEFLGINPFVEQEGHELVLFGERDGSGNLTPGRTLVQDIDYTIDPSSGAISFINPPQAGLEPDQKLVLSYTKQTLLGPFLKDGKLIAPRYRAKYGFVTAPSEDNGFLGASLLAKYTYRNPDSFYYRLVPLASYMGEVAKLAVNRLSSGAAGGPVVTSGGASNNYDYGNLSLLSQRVDLLDQDRAARTFISTYNQIIVAFEQVLETANGEVIGDHDGKFKFFIGRGVTYPPPGYEDEVTGYLNARNVWTDVFLAANGTIRVNVLDPIVDPEDAEQDPSTLEVDGDFMDPDLVTFYTSFQRALVQNDMDDIVLIKRLRPRMAKQAGLPKMRGLGLFQSMWEPHRYSRLFPETALAFTTTYPGLKADLESGDPGVYSFRIMVEPPKLFKGEGAVYGSTFKQAIGSLSNPAYGVIENVTDAEVRDRKPRARVWAYSPDGFADLEPATAGKPSVIATPLFLKDFPIDRDTGLPDVTQLITNGGDLADLGTGDQELSTGAWKAFNRDKSAGPKVQQQVSIGRPTGETLGLGNRDKEISSIFASFSPIDFEQPRYGGIFVHTVYQGCILTFTDGDAGGFPWTSPPSEITDADQILMLGSGSLEGEPLVLSQGDTIYVGPPDGQDMDVDIADSEQSFDNSDEVAENKPTYRRGFDIGVRKSGGEFLDLTLPSIKDPSFPLKEFTGQKGPDPMTTIEADVDFTNTDRDPFDFPALKGEPTNDNGDYGIPYLSFGNTELDRLSAVSTTFDSIVQTDGPSEAVYPSEIVIADGLIYDEGATSPPPRATLITVQNLAPTYTTHSGVGSAAQGDIVLVETYQTVIGDGTHGLLEVGAVDAGNGYLEVPRFVTRTALGDSFRYAFEHAMTHFSTTGLSGMVVNDTGVNTTLDISSVGGLVLNDGTVGVATGGLNDIVNNGLHAYPNENLIEIRIYDRATGVLLETITIDGAVVSAGLGGGILTGVPTFTDDFVTLPGITGIVDFAALGGGPPTTELDFTISIDTFRNTLSTQSASETGRIRPDRLTFQEGYDLRTVLERGTTNVGGVPVAGRLWIRRVTGDASTDLLIDRPAVVNGGDPFTFLSRTGSGIGTWSGGVGTIKVSSWEGHGNDPIAAAGVTLSVIPSSEENETGDICSGTTTTEDGSNFLDGDTAVLVVATGSLSNIVPGDMVHIPYSATGKAAVKAGTYLVRHAIVESNGTLGNPGTHEVDAVVDTNLSSGTWARIVFPKVISVSESPFQLVVDGIQEVENSPSGYAFRSGGPASILYIIKDRTDLSTSIGFKYGSFTVDPISEQVTFNLTSGSGFDANGVGISDATVVATIHRNDTVAGHQYLPIGQFGAALPKNNTQGYDSGATTIGGFTDITLNNNRISGAVAVTYTKGGAPELVDATGGSPANTKLGVWVSDAPGGTYTSDSKSVTASRKTPVYEGVPMFLDLRGISTGQFNNLHNTTGPSIEALVPGDTLETNDGGGNPGFLARAGIYIEPSWPTPTQNLTSGEAKVVDTGHPVVTGSVGMRNYGDFAPSGTSEAVSFIVRRLRRFHAVQDGIATDLGPLRYAYEIRRGVVGSYNDTVPSKPMLTASTPTQLGNFLSADVNVNAGDVVRLLDGGEVVDTAEIASVSNASTLILVPPGFTTTVSSGQQYEIYLRQPPVPHEQSNAELLDLLTDQVIHSVVADPVTGQGGRVDDWNELKDPAVDGVLVTWSDLGVREGDIVLIDPAGELVGASGSPANPVEYGSRPIGDQSLSTRTDGSNIPGQPSELDDNRGWYRVETVGTDTLTVSGVTAFTGADGSPEVYGSIATDQQYVVYPDITGSSTSEGGTNPTEGQMSLRPTAPSDGSDSYKGNQQSIEPFSYRIIRPSSLFSEDAADLILMLRERLLSWMEEMLSSANGDKGGDYYDFQVYEHASDVGSPTDPDAGLGVATNLFITSLSGLTGISPYANVSDCLSVLGRRYWLLDLRLDTESPPNVAGADPYASFENDNSSGSVYSVGSGRPVMPDRISEVLDRSDRFRSLRYAWIKFRTERVNGTLPSIVRFDEELPRKLAEQETLLRLLEGLNNA